MRDEGLVNSDEPFTRLLTQGMVLNQGTKMSKSKGNTVDPQQLIAKYGADTVRLFMMFASPPEQSMEWSDSGAEGAYRFLKRIWAYALQNKDLIRQQNRIPQTNQLGNTDWEHTDHKQRELFRQIYEILHTIKADYERQQFNTVVSGAMKIFNLLSNIPQASTDSIDIKAIIIHKGVSILLRVLAPITPHIAHELWQNLSYPDIILEAPWPKPSPIVFKADMMDIVVQVNGKLRSKISVATEADQSTIETQAKNDPKVQKAIAELAIKKVIYVPSKLINIVVG
jgi:leucyl-tRNA synthetase